MTILNKEDQRSSQTIIDLTGPDGNAFTLIGLAKQYARNIWMTVYRDEFGEAHILPTVNEITEEMMQGDYDNLVEVFDKYFGEYVVLLR